MTLFQRVEELTVTSQNSSKKSIGEFVMRKKSHVSEYTTQQIVDETYTSKAALVRFAKALGYRGWKEFAGAFAAEQHYQESHYSDIDPNFPFTGDDTIPDIIQKMSSLQVESILDTADLLNPRTIKKAADLLVSSRRTALFGLSPNLLLGQLFYRRMMTINKPVEIPLLNDSGLLASSLTSEDCAILISYSGNTRTREPVSLLPILESRKVPVIAVTSVGNNKLRMHAHYTFSISSREKLYSKISTFATEKSIEFILDVLFSVCFSLSYQENLNTKINNGKALEGARIATNHDLVEEV